MSKIFYINTPNAEGIFSAVTSVITEEYKKGVSIFRFVQGDGSNEAAFSLSKKDSAVELALKNKAALEYACIFAGDAENAKHINSIENGIATLLPNGDWKITKKNRVEYLPQKPASEAGAGASASAGAGAVAFGGNAQAKQAETLSLWEYYIKVIKNYANFKGRARRKEYWGFILFNMIIAFGITFCGGFIGGLTGDTGGTLGIVLYYLYCFAVFIPGFAVLIRRIHDTGKSGWNWCWCFTIIGAFYVFYLLCIEGEASENKYGQNPKD